MFLGKNSYLKEITETVSIPCIRKDFSVDTDNSRRLRDRIPTEVLFVSESGVSSAEDVAQLQRIGADAVLVGETLMRAADKGAKLRELRGRSRF